MVQIRNFRFQTLKKATPKLIIVLSVCAVVAYNEVLSFLVSSWGWANLPSSDTADVRALFVADPQLQGFRDEHALLGTITRWDADRYLQLGFYQAVGHLRPDVIVFLGDLLDEGSVASEEEYSTYVRRFNNVFRVPRTVKKVFISGDNDVGGEGFDTKQTWKVDRFRKHFERSSQASDNFRIVPVKFIDFQMISVDFGESMSQSQMDLLRAESLSRFRVTCNHMPLLNRLPAQFAQFIHTVHPHLLVTAHTHKFNLYVCRDCGMHTASISRASLISTTITKPLTFNLSDSSQLYELVIPTCSYRMGVPKMGYGAAVISQNGEMKFDILWLPSRYNQFVVYAVVFILVFILLLISNACKCALFFKKN